MATTLEKLALLAEQRTARTDRLADATHALLAQLDKIAKVGDGVTVDGCALKRVRRKSNIGYNDFWRFERTADPDGDIRSVMLCEPVGEDKFMHGDFHCRIVGPSRQDLIEFSKRAERFVQAFVEKFEATNAELETGADAVERAAEAL